MFLRGNVVVKYAARKVESLDRHKLVALLLLCVIGVIQEPREYQAWKRLLFAEDRTHPSCRYCHRLPSRPVAEFPNLIVRNSSHRC